MKKALFFVMAVLLGHLAFATATLPGNWRWRNDDGTEVTATWKAAQSTPFTLSSLTSPIRLRMSVYSNTVGGTGVGQLQYTATSAAGNNPGNTAYNSAWTTIPVSGTIGTAFTTSASTVIGSAVINPTTAQLSQSGTHTDAFGGGSLYTTTNGASGSITAGFRYETEYTIIPTISIGNSTKYYFRIYDTKNSQTPASANYQNGVPNLTTSATLVPKKFSVTYSTTGVSKVGGSDGAATLNISYGTAPYTILWSNGANTSTVTGLAAGRYTVTVSDNSTPSVVQKRTVEIPTQLVRWGWGYNGNGQLGNNTLTQKTAPSYIGPASDKYVFLSAYYQTSFGIKSDGSLWGWGYNGHNEVGNNSTTAAKLPVAINPGTTWQTVSTGTYHNAGIQTDGTLFTWGYNPNGQLGIGSTTQAPIPVQVGGDKWTAVATGYLHTTAIRADGTLWAWGLNSSGQLGIGNTTQQTLPTQIGTDSSWIAVAAGESSTIGLKSNGTIWGWGINTPAGFNSNVPIQLDAATTWSTIKMNRDQSFIVAIKNDGTAWARGYNGYGQLGTGTTTNATSFVKIGTATNWYSLNNGDDHTLGVKTDGTIQSWGLNSNGQLGTNNTTNRSAPGALNFSLYSPDPNTWGSVAGGYRYSIGLSGVPDNPIPQFSTTVGDSTIANIVPVTVNFTEAVSGVASTDFVVSAGANIPATSFVKVNDSTYTFNLVITAAYSSTTPITVDLAASTATSSYTGLPNVAADELVIYYVEGLKVLYAVTPVTATTPAGVVSTNGGASLTISGGNAPYTQVWSSGETTPYITGKPAGFYTVVVTDASGNVQQRNIEITTVGNLWSWGYNGYGELGTGSNTSTTKPTVVLPIATNTYVMLSSMNATSAGIKSDSTLWMWGYNGHSELGNNSTTWSNAPVKVGTAHWRTVSAGYFHTMGIQVDGTLWGWGYNGYGELGTSNNTNRATPIQIGTDKWIAIAASYIHTIGIKSDGTLWAWGYNGNGQSGNGTTTTTNAPVQIGSDNDWVAVRTGSYYSAAIKADSSAWTFGYNGYGQLGDGTSTQRKSPVQFGDDDSKWTVVNPSGYGAANQTSAIQAIDSTIWGTGWNGYGQKGDGTTTLTKSPTQASDSTDFVDVRQAGFTTLARTSLTTLYAWGLNAWGGIGNGNRATNTTTRSPIKVVRPASLPGNTINWAGFTTGYYHSMALAPAPDRPIPIITTTTENDTTTSASFIATITFSEPVNNFVLADITVSGTTATLSNFTGANGASVYTVKVTPTGGGGYSTITLDVAASVATSTTSPFNPNVAADQFSIVFYKPFTVVGPGGVGNPTVWFKANSGTYIATTGTTLAGDGVAVRQWINNGTANAAGKLPSLTNATSAVTSPIFKANDINFNPGLTFSNANGTILSKTGSVNTADILSTTDYSHFSVAKRKGAGSVIWNFGLNQSGPSGNKTGLEQSSPSNFTFYHNSSSTDADITNQLNFNTIPFAPTDSTWISDAVFSGGNSLATNINTFSTGLTTGATFTALPVLTNSDFRIGNASNSTTGGFTGEIPEVVLYNTSLSTLDQARVRSYLAIKYGATLGSTAVPYSYVNSAGTEIWTADAIFQNDIAGLERDDNGSLYQKQSQSVDSGSGPQPIMGVTAILATNVLNTNTLTDQTAEVWGNNGGTTAFNVPLAGTGSSLTLRMARVWKVQETGVVGVVRIAMPSSIFIGCKALVTSFTSDFTTGNVAYYSRGTQTINGIVCETFDVNFAASSTAGTPYFTFATSPANLPSLVSSSTSKLAGPASCTSTTNYMLFVDTSDASKKYVAINPLASTGYSFTAVTASNNYPLVNHQMKTDNTTHTSALSNRLYTIRDDGTNSGYNMTVRLYFDPADTVAAVNALAGGTVVSRQSSWFKIPGTTHTASVANILRNQTATGITGATLIPTNTTTYGVENGVNYVEFTGITSFSTFGYIAMKTASSILPIALNSFTATATSCAATLNWVTSTESNSNHYDVEASTDGGVFSKVGEVKSKNSATGAAYSYVDNSLTNVITYFRLKAVDNDGKVTYSQTVAVTSNCNGSSLSLSPNPTTNLVNVQGLQSGSHVQLFDVNGKKLTELTAAGASETISLAMYAKGMYILRVQAANGSVTNMKVVKQ